MIERTVKIVCFVLVAAFFAIVGGIPLGLISYDLSPADNAKRARQVIGKLKEMGPRVEEFRRTNGRLPTDTEIQCDLKPCNLQSFIVWKVSPEDDGQFALTYTSLGVMFSPVHTVKTTWRSRDGKTDRDGWDQPWRWYLDYCAKASLAVLVMLLPWIWIGVPRILKWRAARKAKQ